MQAVADKARGRGRQHGSAAAAPAAAGLCADPSPPLPKLAPRAHRAQSRAARTWPRTHSLKVAAALLPAALPEGAAAARPSLREDPSDDFEHNALDARDVDFQKHASRKLNQFLDKVGSMPAHPTRSASDGAPRPHSRAVLLVSASVCASAQLWACTLQAFGSRLAAGVWPTHTRHSAEISGVQLLRSAPTAQVCAGIALKQCLGYRGQPRLSFASDAGDASAQKQGRADPAAMARCVGLCSALRPGMPHRRPPVSIGCVR